MGIVCVCVDSTNLFGAHFPFPCQPKLIDPLGLIETIKPSITGVNMAVIQFSVVAPSAKTMNNLKRLRLMNHNLHVSRDPETLEHFLF